MRWIRCVLLTAFLLAASFSFSQFGALGSSLRWNVIGSGTSSTINEAGYRDVLDKSTLSNYWTQILKQGGVPPTVDFFRDRVVIVFLGQRSSGGYATQISEIRQEGVGRANIVVREMTPPRGAITTQAMTQPWTMISIDRSYGNFKLTFEKVQSQANPGIQIGPMTTLYNSPIQPCFNGWGGGWSTPQCSLFSNWNDFATWGSQNQLNWNAGIPNINWGNQQLMFVTPGNFGLGFNMNILGMQVRGNVGVVQIERTTRVTQIGQGGVPWNTVSVNSSVRQVQVELVDRGSNAFLSAGSITGQTTVTSTILSSTDQMRSFFGDGFGNLPVSVQQFDFKSSNLYLIANPNLGNMRLNRVIYRGSQAEFQFRPDRTTNMGNGVPYQLIKVEKNARSFRVSSN